MLIDVHCHLESYKNNLRQVINRAKKKNVRRIIANGVNPATNRFVMETSSQFKEVLPALGLYPIDALTMTKEHISEEINYIRAQQGTIAAIGEVGIDYKGEINQEKKQVETFTNIISLSKEINKPLIVHSRKAEKTCMELLENFEVKNVVMHCFSGKMNLVDRILKNKWFLSIPTCVNHSTHFQEIIRRAPLSLLLCETDSPFLHPLKEENNEPANVAYSYLKIAEIKGISLKEVERIIEKNACQIFKKL